MTQENSNGKMPGLNLSAQFLLVGSIGCLLWAVLWLVLREVPAMSAGYTFIALTLAVITYVVDRRPSSVVVMNLTGTTNMTASSEILNKVEESYSGREMKSRD